MNEREDYLATTYWHNEVITNPYRVIVELFTSTDVTIMRKTIKSTLLYTGKPKIYQKKRLGNLLHDFRVLESLILAASIINQENKTNVLIVERNLLFDKCLYWGNNNHFDEWHYFPRILSFKEYMDPYIVFRKFFRYQSLSKWQNDLHDILSLSISKNSELYELDRLTLYFLLTKLVEAAHLIFVREFCPYPNQEEPHLKTHNYTPPYKYTPNKNSP